MINLNRVQSPLNIGFKGCSGPFSKELNKYKDGTDALETMRLLSVCHKMRDGKINHNKSNVKKNFKTIYEKIIYLLP